MPGARCFGEVRGLFGGAAARLVVPGARVGAGRRASWASRPCCWRWPPPPSTRSPAATRLPELIVGHGVLGRLLARLPCCRPVASPWSGSATRSAATGPRATRSSIPTEDPRRDYRAICDVSGDAGLLDTLIARLAPGGEIVLAGFYSEPLSFAFPPAFMREARIRVAAEWREADLRRRAASSSRTGRLSLDGLITHRAEAMDAADGLPHRLRRSRLPEDDPGLESLLMSVASDSSSLGSSQLSMADSLRAEAAIEPDPVSTDAADQRDAGHRDLRQGRDRQELHARQPQLHDGPAGQARAADRLRSQERHDLAPVRRAQLPDHHRDLARRRSWPARRSQIGDVCFKRDGVFAMELGGPEVGRGCGGRGIIHGFELLEKLGFHEWGFDYVLLDFLGDVVCGGFGLPIARDMCQKVIVVGSNDLQSLYVANNVCSAVDYFRKMGGNVGVAGMVINKDDGTGEAQAFAEAVGIPVLAAIPADEDIRRKSAQLRDHRHPRRPLGAACSRSWPTQVADAPPVRPKPLTQDDAAGPVQGRGGRPRRGAASRPRWTTCAARRCSRSRRSK